MRKLLEFFADACVEAEKRGDLDNLRPSPETTFVAGTIIDRGTMQRRERARDASETKR